MENDKYMVIGGNPITVYTGTTTFTGIRVVGANLSAEQANELAKDKYDECSGLLLVVNQNTGESNGVY